MNVLMLLMKFVCVEYDVSGGVEGCVVLFDVLFIVKVLLDVIVVNCGEFFGSLRRYRSVRWDIGFC